MGFSRIGSVLPGMALVLIMQAAPTASVQAADAAAQAPPTAPAYVGGQPDAFQKAQKQAVQPDERTVPTPEMQHQLCVEREDPAIGPSMAPASRGTPPCPPKDH